MFIETLRSSRSRLLTAALCVAGLAALSLAANAADRPNCEPITKACNNPLINPPKAATQERPPAKPGTASARRNRCEPITKVCIYKSDTRTDSPAPAVQRTEEPSATSKRHRCEPPTKVCIYR